MLLYKSVHKEYTRKIHKYKDLDMNAYNHLICNSLKLERAQMLVKNKTITNNKKERTNGKYNNMDESQNYKAIHKKLPNV